MTTDLKQPYVLMIGMLLMILAMAFQFDVLSMGVKAPFLFAVAIATGLAAKSVISMRMDAPNTALALFAMAGILLGLTAYMTDVSVFLDAVWEGILSSVAGVGITLLGEAQIRRQTNESQ